MHVITTNEFSALGVWLPKSWLFLKPISIDALNWIWLIASASGFFGRPHLQSNGTSMSTYLNFPELVLLCRVLVFLTFHHPYSPKTRCYRQNFWNIEGRLSLIFFRIITIISTIIISSFFAQQHEKIFCWHPS